MKEWDNEREVSLEGVQGRGAMGGKGGNCRVAFHLQLFMESIRCDAHCRGISSNIR